MGESKSQPPLTEAELAEAISEKAFQKKNVVLSPYTALLVAGALRTQAAKPTRNEIAKILCTSVKCETRCYECTSKANLIMRAYGQRRER